MSTPGLVRVYDSDKIDRDELIVSAVWQSDGYPTQAGLDLAAFLRRLTITRGIGCYDSPIANGMECLAVQIVKNFKEGVGDFYLVKPSDPDSDDGWSYAVHSSTADSEGFPLGQPMLTVRYDTRVLWSGPAAKFTKRTAVAVEKKRG
jgi:hypothetical protein